MTLYSERQVECFNAHDQYRLMIEAFAAEARGETPHLVPLAFSRANQVALDGLLASGTTEVAA